MSRMNWEGAAQRSAATAGMGFQDMADAADERWFQREMERETRIEASRTARAETAAGKPLTRPARRDLRADADSVGLDLEKVPLDVQRRLFGSIGEEANRFRMDAAKLRDRRLRALKAGHPADAIVKAGRIDGPIGTGPLRRQTKSRLTPAWGAPPPLPMSTAERNRREMASPRPRSPSAEASRRLITSSGAGKPPVRQAEALRVERVSAGPAENAQSRPTAKQTKRARDLATAAKRNIAVEALRAERVVAARQDAALAAEAKVLGITTKELRKARMSGNG